MDTEETIKKQRIAYFIASHNLDLWLSYGKLENPLEKDLYDALLETDYGNYILDLHKETFGFI